MDIGKEKPAIIVEPIEDPFRRDEPAPEREKSPDPSPAREPETVPASRRGFSLPRT